MNFSLPDIFHRVSRKDKAFFVRQLAIMVSGGVALAQALRLTYQQTTNDTLRGVIRTMVADVEHGQSLSQSAARFPALFDEVTIAMLKSGEATGQLTLVLQEISEQMSRDVDFSTKVRNALLYPAFVFVVMVIVALIMTTVVIPRLSALFDDSSVHLPWTTQILVGASNLLLHWWYYVLIFVVAMVLVVRAYLITSSGKVFLHNLQMAIPVIRDLTMNSYLVRFTDILGMLTKAGVPITESLRIVGSALGSPALEKALTSVRQEVERGVPLSAALTRHNLFPPTLTQMIAVGEQTGKLDEILATMSDFYQQQTDGAIKGLTALIEPTILLIVAVGVGFVVISVILPIYGLANQI